MERLIRDESTVVASAPIAKPNVYAEEETAAIKEGLEEIWKWACKEMSALIRSDFLAGAMEEGAQGLGFGGVSRVEEVG